MAQYWERSMRNFFCNQCLYECEDIDIPAQSLDDTIVNTKRKEDFTHI